MLTATSPGSAGPRRPKSLTRAAIKSFKIDEYKDRISVLGQTGVAGLADNASGFPQAGQLSEDRLVGGLAGHANGRPCEASGPGGEGTMSARRMANGGGRWVGRVGAHPRQ